MGEILLAGSATGAQGGKVGFDALQPGKARGIVQPQRGQQRGAGGGHGVHQVQQRGSRHGGMAARPVRQRRALSGW